MSRAHPPLTLQDVDDHIRRAVFGVDGCLDLDEATARRCTGIELEWLTRFLGQGRITQRQADALVAAVTPMPGGSHLTMEPGGQLELSSARFETLRDATEAMSNDLFVLDKECATRGIALVALGADPMRPPERVLQAPRYSAMETFFDHDASAGRTMMCNTASIQVNVGLGPEQHTMDRWRLANALCPTLIATFANSPLANGAPSGWQSTRLRAWWLLDPSRAAPPALDGDPIDRWIDYVLAARVMLIRTDDGFVPITEPMTFGRWLADGHELGGPTIDDLAYHLTTLFPPVRPRGWFEVRVLDALPTPFWQVAVAVTHALLTDHEVHVDALAAVAGTEELWIDAAQLGLGHPRLQESSLRAMRLALAVLEEAGHDPAITELIASYIERWPARGRSPADDRLDAWRKDGSLFPARESPVPYGRDVYSDDRR